MSQTAESRRTTGSRGRLTSDAPKVFHGPGRVNFTSPLHLKHPSETGFTANQRPAICYTPSLDRTDNPQFGLLLSDSFMSQTKQHYRPHIHYDSSKFLPNLTDRRRHSGFHQLRTHQKTESDAEKTEYQRLFVPHHLTSTVSQKLVNIGAREQTGFTAGADLHYNTFQEENSCRARVERHQTHTSVMKNDFLPTSFLQGAESMPSPCSRSCQETGFSRDATAPLASATSSSTPVCKTNAPTVRIIGKKEPTGFLLNGPNNQVFPNKSFDCLHFTTHYKSKFSPDAGLEELRSSHGGAGVLSSKMENAYNRRDMDRFIIKG
ncbi:protein phosphatase 1 regulatory subunit 32 [Solea solea]|uniref:protein phosphatase 1 regulatory subunit 32 n=1 Tax=Solea solea TaxID=90069 RepID=UPI00272D77B3|nr:protein phosphatase 1 regulatory subunit 32 [Solea solea]